MRKAQSTLEYVFSIALVAAAIIAISVYIGRGFQGRLRLQADQLGEQYSPKNMSTDYKQNSTVVYTDKVVKDETWSDSKTTTTTVGGSYERARNLKYEHY